MKKSRAWQRFEGNGIGNVPTEMAPRYLVTVGVCLPSVGIYVFALQILLETLMIPLSFPTHYLSQTSTRFVGQTHKTLRPFVRLPYKLKRPLILVVIVFLLG